MAGNWWNNRDRGKVADKEPEFTDEVKERAKELGIEPDEIKAGGGYRQDSFKLIWWIPLDKLVYYFEKNDEIVDDAAFWKWMDDWVFDEKFSHSKTKGVSYGDYHGGYSSSSKKDYLTDWWKGWGYSGSVGSNDDERRLAIALGAVKTTVDVVNSSGKRYLVEFSSSDGQPVSYTSYDERRIAVSPAALLDKAVGEAKGIKVTSGFGLHEASHAQYSEPLLKALTEPSELLPLSITSLLHNLLEDLRIEYLTAEKFPGFADYFDDANEYLWSKTKDHAPTEWQGKDINSRISSIIASAKWPTEYEEIAKASSDPELLPEMEWWRDWGERYKGGADIRFSLEEGMNRLQQDPDIKKEIERIKKAEEEFEKNNGIDLSQMSDGEFENWLKELQKSIGKPGLDPCPSHGEGMPVKMTREQAEKVNQLIRDQLQKFDANVPERFPDGAENAPDIYVQRPSEKSNSYKRPAAALLAKMKSAFFFRRATAVWSERLLKAGSIDDEELWRVASDPPDVRVFERRVIEEAPDTAVTMLVDLSGSMSGRNTENSQALATVMLECLKTMKGVSVRVRGHRTEGNGCGIFRIWEPGDDITRIGLITDLIGGSNYDGYAIDWCANELVQLAKPNENKVLIVLSDGRPNGHASYYGGEPAEEHVRRVGEHYEKRGVTTIQIAIDPAVGTHIQAKMFKHFIPFRTAEELPQQLTRLLIKLFSTD